MEEQRIRFGMPERETLVLVPYHASGTQSLYLDPHAPHEGQRLVVNRAQRRAIKKKRRATKAGRKAAR
jgi:hypothetical protein